MLGTEPYAPLCSQPHLHSPGHGASRVGQHPAQPPHPTIFAGVWPLYSTRSTGLCSAAHFMRGERKTDHRHSAATHSRHRFPWRTFPLPLSAEEPAKRRKPGWGLGSGGLWCGWDGGWGWG